MALATSQALQGLLQGIVACNPTSCRNGKTLIDSLGVLSPFIVTVFAAASLASDCLSASGCQALPRYRKSQRSSLSRDMPATVT